MAAAEVDGQKEGKPVSHNAPVLKSASLRRSVTSDSASPPLRTVFPKWWRVAKLWYTDDKERWKARGFAVSVVALALVNTIFSVHISYAQRDFSTALSEKDVPGFYRAVWKFAVIIIIAAPLFSFTAWVEERLVLSWRAYLSRRLMHAYFQDRAYYEIQQRNDASDAQASGSASSPPQQAAAGGGPGGGSIDNPDQRICDDVTSFVRSSMALSLTLCRKVFNCVAFAGVLWSVSGHLVVFMLAYAGVGTLVTTAAFGRVLSSLYFRTIAREADLRFSLVRVREHAESIAFYRGESGERQRVLSRLEHVLGVWRDRIRWGALYDVWTNAYSYATILVPALLTAPRYFAGEIEFGVISQASFAYGRIDAALSVIIMNLAQISGLAAETERLDALISAMSAAAGENSDAPSAAAASLRMLSSPGGGADVISRRSDPLLRGLVLKELRVVTPGGAVTLAAGLSLGLEQGQSLLVVGPSGCGKSSLLRAIAGLWHAGGGTVVLPGPERRAVFFLPQKPFMPLGNLRTQLTFPSALAAPEQSAGSSAAAGDEETGGGSGSRDEGAASEGEGVPLLARGRDAEGGSSAEGGGAEGGGGTRQLSDTALLALLDDVNLPDLIYRVGGLDVELDWGAVLSVGEQQRVAVLRLLAARPTLAFLDEATSALDGPTEGRLYHLIRKHVGCYVSVGHRMQLLQHHTHVLECVGGGEWRLSAAADYQRRMAAGGPAAGVYH